MCAGVLNTRFTTFIVKECRYKFEKHYHIVESQIVRAMIQKETYGFNTCAAKRIGKIQEGTNPSDWYWMEGELSIADWITRGKKPKEIDADSSWKKGPEFSQKADSEWPIKKIFNGEELLERVKTAMTTQVTVNDTTSPEIDITRYSSHTKLIRVTARVLAVSQRNSRPSLKNAAKTSTPADIERAELFRNRKPQESLKELVIEGKFKRIRDDAWDHYVMQRKGCR